MGFALFVSWVSAMNLLARVVRLDSFSRMIWNVASLVPVQDFSDATILVRHLGVRLEHVTSRERPTMPEWALQMRSGASLQDFGGPLADVGATCTVCAAARDLGLAPLVDGRREQVCWGCRVCLSVWHRECAIRFDPDSIVMAGASFTCPLCVSGGMD